MACNVRLIGDNAEPLAKMVGCFLDIMAKKVDDTYFVFDHKNIAFDHAQIILFGLSRLRHKICYTDVIFNLMPEYFTFRELQTIHELILGQKLLTPAFRRSMGGKLELTDKVISGVGHRQSSTPYISP